MKNIVFTMLGLILCSAVYAGTENPQNCVNPGGGCDGSVPCCNASVNACVRGRCEAVPRFIEELLKAAFQSKNGAPVANSPEADGTSSRN